jgi:hypothetical protein
MQFAWLYNINPSLDSLLLPAGPQAQNLSHPQFYKCCQSRWHQALGQSTLQAYELSGPLLTIPPLPQGSVAIISSLHRLQLPLGLSSLIHPSRPGCPKGSCYITANGRPAIPPSQCVFLSSANRQGPPYFNCSQSSVCFRGPFCPLASPFNRSNVCFLFSGYAASSTLINDLNGCLWPSRYRSQEHGHKVSAKSGYAPASASISFTAVHISRPIGMSLLAACWQRLPQPPISASLPWAWIINTTHKA